MKISPLTNFNITKNRSQPVFKRAPSPDIIVDEKGTTEEQDYENTIRRAKNFLGIANLALILHQSSFPVKKNDLFAGSHIDSAAVEVNKFLKLHGFDSIQLGPPGLTRLSPYNSGVNSKNYLYADMEKLSTPAYARILPEAAIEKLLDSIDKDRIYEKNADQTRFNRAFYVHDKLFALAYDNMIKKSASKDAQAMKLNAEFNSYKEKEGAWLENDAIFEHFKKKFGMDDNFFDWPQMNRNLIKYKNDPSSPYHEEALNYISNINKKHGRELEIYKFKQFILDRQEREFIKENPDKLNYITDAIIGFSLADYWSNQDAFLENYRIGTPFGGEGMPVGGTCRGQNQTWDIPVLDPKKLFIKDENGTITGLGISGVVLKNKFEKLLDTYQNIRVDHVIGLIDPWIYNKNNVEIHYGRYEYEDNNVPEHIIYKDAHGANISQMGKPNVYNAQEKGWDSNITREINKEIENMPEVDPDGDYAKILDEILLPLMAEKGLEVEDAVWESLGCNTPKFDEVYSNPARPLPGISSSYQYQLEYRPRKDWMMIGSHDNPPFANVCTDEFYSEKAGNGGIMNGAYLYGNLYPEASSEKRQNLIDNLKWDRRARVKAKYEELLRFGEKIQFMFMDFFGLDKTYNYAGTQNSDNWKLRLKKSYKEDYYRALAWQPGDKGVNNVPVNMPEQLKRAVIAKIGTGGGDFAEQKPLIDKLEHYEQVLKEKG